MRTKYSTYGLSGSQSCHVLKGWVITARGRSRTQAKITLGRSPGEGNGNPLQYSCLENPMDGGAWWAAVHEVAESWTRLSDFILTFHFHALEKEMVTHSSILAWRIPGIGEPGGLHSPVYGVAQNRTWLKWLSSIWQYSILDNIRDVVYDNILY